MNWIGISWRALFAAIVGAALGFFAYGALVAHDFEAPWLVALLAGVGAAATSRDKSVLRGLVIGTLAMWVAASAQAFYRPLEAHDPVWLGLVHFHETLTPSRWIAFAATVFIAIGLGATSFTKTPPVGAAQPR